MIVNIILILILLLTQKNLTSNNTAKVFEGWINKPNQGDPLTANVTTASVNFTDIRTPETSLEYLEDLYRYFLIRTSPSPSKKERFLSNTVFQNYGRLNITDVIFKENFNMVYSANTNIEYKKLDKDQEKKEKEKKGSIGFSYRVSDTPRFSQLRKKIESWVIQILT